MVRLKFLFEARRDLARRPPKNFSCHGRGAILSCPAFPFGSGPEPYWVRVASFQEVSLVLRSTLLPLSLALLTVSLLRAHGDPAMTDSGYGHARVSASAAAALDPVDLAVDDVLLSTT